MIKTIIRAMYSAFISIVLISMVFAGWTGYAFISQSTKSNEIINVLQDMYKSQKSVVFDFIELSKILLKDTSERSANENNNLLPERGSLKDLSDKAQLDESFILEDNGDNPLGIIIEPSLLEGSETILPEIVLDPLDNEQSEVSMNEMAIGMDMN